MVYLLVYCFLCGIVVGVGQAFWKQALTHFDQTGYIQLLVNLTSSGLFWIGSLCYLIATLWWFYLLNNIPFSRAYPSMFAGIMAALVAYTLIYEATHFDWSLIIGLAFLFVGVGFIAYGLEQQSMKNIP